MVFMRDRVSDWGLYLVQCRRLGKVIVFRLLMMMQYVSSSVLYCIQSDLKKVFHTEHKLQLRSAVTPILGQANRADGSCKFKSNFQQTPPFRPEPARMASFPSKTLPTMHPFTRGFTVYDPSSSPRSSGRF